LRSLQKCHELKQASLQKQNSKKNSTITSGLSAQKYETESVSGFGLFGLLGMVWEGLEGLIGVRYNSTDYTDFKSTNTSEGFTLGKPYSISDAQLIFGLGYSF
jgi:hypothetical protein